MNKASKLLLIVWIAPLYCNACPSCVGTVNEDSAPFFSDDCYKGEQSSTSQAIKAGEKGVNHE